MRGDCLSSPLLITETGVRAGHQEQGGKQSEHGDGGRARSQGGRPAALGRDCAGYRPCGREHSALDRGLSIETERQVLSFGRRLPSACGWWLELPQRECGLSRRVFKISDCLGVTGARPGDSAGPSHMSAPWGVGVGDLAVCGFLRCPGSAVWHCHGSWHTARQQDTPIVPTRPQPARFSSRWGAVLGPTEQTPEMGCVQHELHCTWS